MSTINTDPNHILTLDEMKPKASSNGELGKDDFLKLFVAQLSHQDPMNPMNDQDMMGQMASFSQLEQITNMAAANQSMATNLSSSASEGSLNTTFMYERESRSTGAW